MIGSPLLRWLLGIRSIPADAGEVQFAWGNPLAGWVWLLVITGAILLAALAYSQVRVHGPRRVALATLRGAALLLLVTLFAQPILMLPVEEREPDTVAVLVDRSRSMLVGDAAAAGGQSRSREAQLAEALADPAWAELTRDGRRIEWIGFHDAAFDLPVDSSGHPRLGAAEGWRTGIPAALREAVRRLEGRPACGIVIITDGTSTDTIDTGTLRSLSQRGLGVFPVPLGSGGAVQDLAVVRALAPQRAFTHDEVPVGVEVASGVGEPSAPVTVELVRESDGTVMDTATIEPGQFRAGRAEAWLTGVPEEAGQHRWSVRVRGEERDIAPANDAQEVTVSGVDRPVRVLYVEGYPRWEYRYLKNLLVREESIESSIMLLSADEEFAQEGDQPLERLPATAEEFAKFDVIVLGDLPAGRLSPQQAEAIREGVARRGTGLLWIGGSRSTPSSWEGSALEDLLPMRPPLGLERSDEALATEPTEAARRLGVLRLGAGMGDAWPATLAPGGAGWAQLLWSQRIDARSIKPAGEVLLEGRAAPGARAQPLVISMRYGAGQSAFVATDETWRWRNGTGERLQEKFWIGLVRMLARPALESAQGALRLEVTPEAPVAEQESILRLEVMDAGLPLADVDSVTCVATGPEGATSRVTMRRDGHADGGAAFLGSWDPGREGAWTLTVDDARLGPSLSMGVTVTRPDLEMAAPRADHAALVALARATGGSVIPPESLARLGEILPNRSVVVERPITDRLWSSPLALMLLVGILGAEWLGRRVLRLD